MQLHSIINKYYSFKKLAYSYVIVASIEIVIRYLYMPSSLSLLFPTLILCMFLGIKNKEIDLKSHWFLLLPFFIYSGLFLFLFSYYTYDKALYLWSPIYNIGYSILSLLYMAPIFLSVLSFNFSLVITRKSAVVFLLFTLTIIYALGNLTLMHFILPLIAENKEAIYTYSDSFWTEWFLLLISFMVVLLYILLSKKDEKESDFPTLKELEHYKKRIIELLNGDKKYLDPNFTFQILALDTGIDKKHLNYFFEFYIQKDFLSLLAEYRIGHALNLMKSDIGGAYTMEAIANESGYRSRASFNKYFQQITGMLPSEYIELLKK